MASSPDMTSWNGTDVWSGLDHKRGMNAGPAGRRVGSWLAPTWIEVGSHPRRLTAYRILEDYYSNKARQHLNTENETTKDNHREFGDVALFVEAVLAALMGDEQSIVVDGADDDGNTAAQDMQQWFDSWAIKERLRSKVKEVERTSVKLGDGIYVLGADTKRKRVRLRIFDPGFYFPVIDPNQPEDEFPETVHLAWQYEDPDGSGTMWLRRISYRLGPILPQVDVDGNVPDDDTDNVLLIDGDAYDNDGRITRKLPWNDDPTDVTCYMTDAIFKLEDIEENYHVENIPTRLATRFLTNSDGDDIVNLDLQYDFIPLIHMPNSVQILGHFGKSVVTSVAQSFDELSAADTDAAAAAALAGVPAVVVKGVGVQNLTVKPGAVIPIGEDGDFEVLDLSASLTAILEYVETLKRRTSQNGRVPDEWLGRVNSSEVPSGFALAMGFSPLRSLIDEMRIVRDEKYPVLFKFVQRIAVLFGWLQGDVLDATLSFGSFLPSDEATIIETTTKLYREKLITRATAISMLVDAGVIDVEVNEEAEAAGAEDYAAAIALADATSSSSGGDLDAVYELLSLERPEEEPVEPQQQAPVVVDANAFGVAGDADES